MVLTLIDLRFDESQIKKGTFADYLDEKIGKYFKIEYDKAYEDGIKGISKEKLKDLLLGSETEVCYHGINCESLDNFLKKLNLPIGITLTNASSLLMKHLGEFNKISDYPDKASEWFNFIEKDINKFETIIIPDMFIISLKVGTSFNTYLQTLESKLSVTENDIYIPISYSLKNNSYV